jgi:vacuolar protein sorting-associated protein 53
MSQALHASAGLKDPFDGDDFDPIRYINEKFPDESSLVNLDTVIGDLRGEVARLDEEILEGIHEHAMLNSQMKVEIANTKTLTATIVQEIKSIKEKAIQSENIVHDMCMDIKLLDTAKRNLTTSINTLRKFSDLMRSLDNLRDFCADREYGEAANCLKGINDLLAFFKPFESIPQVREMVEERDLILTKAKDQIKDDFAMFFKGTSSLAVDTLKAGCHLVEIIGPKFRNDIMMMPAELILEPYRKIYSKPDNNTLENVEQRYAWFVKELREFNEKFAQAFPHYWGLINYITQNFATTTRVHIAELLSTNSFNKPDDVRSLTNALRATKMFENKIADDLAREYQQYIGEERHDKDGKQQYRINQLYKIRGSISACFEGNMRPYVENERQDLESSIRSELQKDLSDPVSNSLQTEEISILNSALLMFNKMKHLINRASKISESQTMFDIYRVIKQTIKNFVQLISDDGKVKEKSKTKNYAFFFNSICIYVNTIDHVKDTLPSVNDLLVSRLEPTFAEQVDFGPEEDDCLDKINELVFMIKRIPEATMDSAFSGSFSKINWDRFDDHGQDVSKYVVEIREAVRGVMDSIKGKILTAHYTRLLNLLCQVLSQKFVAAILKLKRVSDAGINQLQKDYNDIKCEFEVLGKDANTIYTKVLQSATEKVLSIISLIGSNNTQIVQNIKAFKDSVTSADLQTILTNKGFKKHEIVNLLGTLESN